MSENDVKLLNYMSKETISMRRKLEKINMDYTLRKSKIVTTITNQTIQKLMHENNDKKLKIKLLFFKSKSESAALRSLLNSL